MKNRLLNIFVDIVWRKLDSTDFCPTAA